MYCVINFVVAIFGFVCIPSKVLVAKYGFACIQLYLNCFVAMDRSSFYGSSSHVNVFPGDGSVSDDDLTSDSDPDYEPISLRVPEGKKN